MLQLFSKKKISCQVNSFQLNTNEIMLITYSYAMPIHSYNFYFSYFYNYNFIAIIVYDSSSFNTYRSIYIIKYAKNKKIYISKPVLAENVS